MDKVGVATRGTHQNRAAPTWAAQHPRAGVALSALPLGLTWLGLAGLVGIDTGVKGVSLFLLGSLLGGAFLGFQYGFASGWRRWLETGDGLPVAAHFLLVGLCMLVFIPATHGIFDGALFDVAARGTIAPVATSLVIGAFLFGIGMQLANGCGSGVLFTFGGGSGRMLVALPFFVLGSLLGSFLVPTALGWGSFGKVAIAGDTSWPIQLAINLALVGLVGGWFFWRRDKQQATNKWRGLVIGSVLIAALCWLVLLISGHPWGVTFGFTLWGAKIATALSVPVADFAFWQWTGPAQALQQSVLANSSSLMDIGMLLGAAITAIIGKTYASAAWPNQRQMLAAAIGGLLMGVGARLAFGCNIGAFLAGIASGSAHGWLWFVMAMLGSLVGLKIRPLFGFQRD
jgi:uncharacterized membrane protein YedE/YeeE